MTTLTLYTTATTDNDADVNKKLINKQNKNKIPIIYSLQGYFISLCLCNIKNDKKRWKTC